LNAPERLPPDLRAPRWLPGGHVQTIWPAWAGRRRLADAVPLRRERWDTPDGDFVDVDFAPSGAARCAAAGAVPRPGGLLRASHYARAFALAALARGWSYAVPHFRGCSGELNRAPRAYHSGDFAEIGWMLARLRARHGAPLLAVGVSLGGNALLRWAAEAGDTAWADACAVAAVCAPVDLAAAGAAHRAAVSTGSSTRACSCAR
jgi:uncharacterized protein